MSWKDVFEIFILYELVYLIVVNVKMKIKISVYEELYGIMGVNVDRIKKMSIAEIVRYFLTK